MNNLDKNPNSTNKSSSIGAKLKSLFSSKTTKMENEIDYYHQYIFPHKANKLLKEKQNPKNISYVPFFKRDSRN